MDYLAAGPWLNGIVQLVVSCYKITNSTSSLPVQRGLFQYIFWDILLYTVTVWAS